MTKILIIGRGEDEKNFNGNYFKFIESACINNRPDCDENNIISIADYDFVLQHISDANEEFNIAIQKWIKDYHKDKIVGISGGDALAGYGAINAGRLGIPHIRATTAEFVIELINRKIPSDFSGNAESLVNELKDSEVLRLLPALTILCQGYLAVHAVNGEDDKELLEPALRQMGWFDLGDDREKISQVLKNKKDEVESAKWWLAPFGLDGSENSESKWKEFKKNLKNEKKGAGKGDWITVDNFINNNMKNGELDSPGIIAKVYCSLVSMLEGRPCST